MTENEKWLDEFINLANNPSHIDKLPCIPCSESDMEEYYKRLAIYKNQNKNHLSSCIKELINVLSSIIRIICCNVSDVIFEYYKPP